MRSPGVPRPVVRNATVVATSAATTSVTSVSSPMR